MRTSVTGYIIATCGRTGAEHRRRFKPFFADTETPWTALVDHAMECAFPEGEWIDAEEFIDEELLGEEG